MPPSRLLPMKAKGTLNYADSKVLTAGVSAATSNVYRVNSLFDPDYSGTGTQPVGFDNWALLYGRYRVDAIDYEVCFVPGNATAQLIVAVVQNNLTAISTTDGLYAGASNPFGSARLITGYTGGYGNTAPIVGHIELHELSGLTKTEYEADDRFQALVSTNPTETMGLLIANGAAGSAASSAICAYSVRLRYHVTFFDRDALPVS